MQIMPAVARQFNITSSEELFDPETNIRVGNQVLNQIYSSLRLPAGVSQKDRMSLALPATTAGSAMSMMQDDSPAPMARIPTAGRSFRVTWS